MELNYEGFEDNMLKHQKETTFTSGGDQYIFRFENNYGASVINSMSSWGGKQGLWELAVLWFTGDEYFEYLLCYHTPITNDVLGCLTDTNVRKILQEIKEL